MRLIEKGDFMLFLIYIDKKMVYLHNKDITHKLLRTSISV